MSAAPLRVAGADPGTGSLDLLVLEDGAVRDQARFAPEALQADAAAPVRWLEERGPFALVAGPSGYGLPLVRARDCGEQERSLMELVRPDERGRAEGVAAFSALVSAFCAASLPVVFLPGVIHLPTVPSYRKHNRIDLGTPDKLCVAALALAQRSAARGVALGDYGGCVVEMGSVFTACVVLSGGRIVDGVGGTSGPIGWAGGGAWDGETAYLLSPLRKSDLFRSGAASLENAEEGRRLFCESLLKAVAGLRAATPFDEIVLSGRLLESEPTVIDEVAAELRRIAAVARLEALPGAWVKHAAQGAALVADGLAGGRQAALVEQLRLREASGTVLDGLSAPRLISLKARSVSEG
jgi:predicted butyrate kinase (DUF1464 family)